VGATGAVHEEGDARLMRILWVKANKILPGNSGGDIRSFNILRRLATCHSVVFFSYYDGDRDRAYETELEKELPGALCACTGKGRQSTLARGWNYVLRTPNAEPYAVSRFASAAVRGRLQKYLSRESPDVVICDFLDAAINFPDSLEAPSVLFQHNVESEIWRRHATNVANPVKRLVYRREFSRMLRYEQAAVQRFDHVIAVSEHDKNLMSRWVEPERISVVPTGVDTERFCPGARSGAERPLVVFVGAMDWEPNVDAVKYFCDDIWPHILTKVPEARFRIVGRNPGRQVTGLAGSSIEVTGSVPSVVEHLREAAVVVVPLRVGGGTRLKIYEAMAAGKAVVSTTVGAEGLDVHHGRNIVLADSAVAFAESVIALLEDSRARHRIGEDAIALARKYSWPVIAEKFGEVLGQVVERRGKAAPSQHVLAAQ
jgi:glycosyltransferase involved in cell wall biosynthesis